MSHVATISLPPLPAGLKLWETSAFTFVAKRGLAQQDSMLCHSVEVCQIVQSRACGRGRCTRAISANHPNGESKSRLSPSEHPNPTTKIE